MQYFGLFTDLYQLTMAYGYWRLNRHEQEAIFNLFYRTNPFNGNYAVSCGLGTIQELIKQYHFCAEDLSYLSSLRNANNKLLFDADFLSYLEQLNFTVSIWAIPEGTIVGPNQPLLRVQGPLLQCQLLEALLLNNINFQTLIATKTTRIISAANGDEVIELGMRSAHGTDGALSASRAAYIGGCSATSNVCAGKKYQIPVRGTHAHSWVSAFDNELEAFASYVQVIPEQPILLIDTYNSLTGIKNAIKIGQQLRANNYDLFGVRLDSGDLRALSMKVRAALDEAGFYSTKIIASGNLDEAKISSLKQQQAPITTWGVGSNLVSPNNHGALNGVYKLAALRKHDGTWRHVIKVSDDPLKSSLPGQQQIRRFYHHGQAIGDIIYDLNLGIEPYPVSQELVISHYDHYHDLLVPILHNGQEINPPATISTIRTACCANLVQFKRYYIDKIYPIGVEQKLRHAKNTLLQALQQQT